MGRKPKVKSKLTSRSRKRAFKPSGTQPLQPNEMEETVTEQEERSGEGSPIIVRGREAVREVLEMVSQMPYPGVGLRTIAGILRGETRANWLSYIARTESWGVFFPNPLPVVEGFIRELIRSGYLEGSHFIRLTERGQRVLENQETPPIRRRLKIVSRKVRPLLWKLLLLRARLVNERKAPGLFKDKVLLQLLEKQPTTVDELKQIKGVGKFIVQRLGEEIVQIINSFKSNAKDRGKDSGKTNSGV
ncbi:MAG: HRDC domain-containing protein [Armatimonadetes bacterium]|nr:HRDC domain-containing protein [Armatimonadota bacterium]